MLDRFLVVNVAGDTFHASGFQRFGIRLGRVTCDTTNLEFIGGLGIVQDGIDDRTTLITSCAENNDDFFLIRHCVIDDASISFFSNDICFIYVLCFLFSGVLYFLLYLTCGV